MPFLRSAVVAAGLLLAVVGRADETPKLPPAVVDAAYKGVVGKALDNVPMDPERRVTLQRTNAVVGNTLAGRSVSAWLGLTNPLLMAAGLAWGLFAASKIKPSAKPDAKPDPGPAEPPARIETGSIQLPTAPPAEAPHAD